MVFSSNEFLFFFLPTALVANLAVLLITRRSRAGIWVANLLLLMFSLLFYAWGEPRYIVLLLGSGILNYLGGLALGIRYRSVRTRAVVLGGFIAANLLALIVFKYLNFFQSVGGIELLNKILPASLSIGRIGHIALPIGISFYTFQGVSYLIDVYRKDTPSCRGLVEFLCYLTMFPQLIAGPIVRFRDVHEDLRAREISVDRIASGCTRFIIGLAKKVLLADTFARIADITFSLPPGSLGAEHAWLGLICYTFQIYFDFSGYSDMAIGIGNILGVTFKENFLHPYSSRSIKEFWRRWHISLSSWFRDYLYIPLGGSRKGSYRLYLNLLVVFTLCGFWHGAAWNFLLWGIFHGFFLVIERVGEGRARSVPGAIKWCYSIFVVMMGWVLFRADTVTGAFGYYKALFGLTNPGIVETNSIRLAAYGYVLPICLLIALVSAMPVYPFLRETIEERFGGENPGLLRSLIQIAGYIVLLTVFALTIGAITSSTYQAFIYFRF